MSKRRKRGRLAEKGDNSERWMISYADFLTLLFTFFVVMYSVSAVNDGKYRVASESLIKAFTNARGDLIPRIEVLPYTSKSQKAKKEVRDEAKPKEADREKTEKMLGDIADVMEPLVRSGKVRIVQTPRGLSIEVSDSILFSPGQANLGSYAEQAMLAVAAVIADADFPVVIEGHTDDVPINTAQFPSNWELSAVRATTVLRVFLKAGVKATRLTAIGYSDQQPVESNGTVEGRARNRRVNIQIDVAQMKNG